MSGDRLLLNIITPVSRPCNLLAIYNSIRAIPFNHVKWFTVFDPLQEQALPGWRSSFRPSPTSAQREDGSFQIEATVGGRRGGWGGSKRIDALHRIDHGWCYFLDDDNLMHPHFLVALALGLSEQPAAKVLVFHQAWKDGAVRLQASPERMKFGQVDTGQFVIDRALLRTTRTSENLQSPLMDWSDDYCADWKFIERIWKLAPTKFYFVPRVATYYNALR